MDKTDNLYEQVDLIREVFLYTHRFKDTTFVIKIDDSLFDHITFPVLIQDLALLHRNGIRMILVPGASGRINQILKEYDIATEFHRGIRISPPETLPFIKMAAFDVSNTLMTALAAENLTAVIGNWVNARALGVEDGVDYQHSGTVHRVDGETVRKIIAEGLIPIFPCIGWSTSGKPYNISSTELAVRVAAQLGAEKLFFVDALEDLTAADLPALSEESVVVDGRISRITLTDARVAVSSRQGEPRALALLEGAVQACEGGVDRVHIVDGRIQGVILKEIFSNQGIGTMIHDNPFEKIRPLDGPALPHVMRLIKPYVDQGILIHRDEETVKERMGDYHIYELDGSVYACGALHVLEPGTGEIAALAVDPGYVHLQLGRKMVAFLIREARRRRMNRLFTLTTQTADWFESLGFRPACLEDLPEAKRKSYNPRRNSKIYLLEL